MYSPGPEPGEHASVRGKMQRTTTCVVIAGDSLARGEARLSEAAATSVRLAEGEDVIVSAVRELPVAERVLLLPYADDVKEVDGDPFDLSLAPYLKGADRPLTVGDVLSAPCGDEEGAPVVRWKVLEIEPASEVGAASGTVGEDTVVFTEGDPIEEEDGAAGADAVGYDDIGGMKQQLNTLRELIDLPLKHPEVFGEIAVDLGSRRG